MDALGLEPRAAGEAAEDQEGAGARERSALRVQEQIGPVALVEVGPSVRQVAAQRLDRVPPDGYDALLAALAGAAHEPLLEVDAGPVEADRLAHPQAGAVEELDERAVSHHPRGRARC